LSRALSHLSLWILLEITVHVVDWNVISSCRLQVHPSDVMDPSSPGPIFILVDCPALSYIPALLSAPDLCCLQEKHPDTGSPLKQVTLMVHISPASVTSDARYQKWMLQFEGAQHVLAGHDL
jgi:ribonuclease Z